jgi:hypothetical protein
MRPLVAHRGEGLGQGKLAGLRPQTSLSIVGGRAGYRPPSTFCEGTWVVRSSPEPSEGGGITTNVCTSNLRGAPLPPR